MMERVLAMAKMAQAKRSQQVLVMLRAGTTLRPLVENLWVWAAMPVDHRTSLRNRGMLFLSILAASPAGILRVE